MSRGVIASPAADPDVHLVAVLEFDNMTALRAEFGSPRVRLRLRIDDSSHPTRTW